MNEIIKKGARLLLSVSNNDTEAKSNARALLCHVTGKSFLELVYIKTIKEDVEKKYFEYIHEMIKTHKPLAYILGTAPFLNLMLDIVPPILIPRPETEFWCDELLKFLDTSSKNPSHILDMCTGSGCLALTLALHYKYSEVTAVDCDEAACMLAMQNFKKHRADKRIKTLKSDLFACFKNNETFDLIVSNPPYISINEYESLDSSVKKWEAFHALSDNNDGMSVVKDIINASRFHLNKEGLLVIEINEFHAHEIYLYTKSLSWYSAIQLVHDQYNKPRALMLFS